jgi:hypothetical protein
MTLDKRFSVAYILVTINYSKIIIYMIYFFKYLFFNRGNRNGRNVNGKDKRLRFHR